MPTAGKLEITIKINEFSEPIRTVENGWKEFDFDCDGCIITVKVKPKVFNKLEQAQQTIPCRSVPSLGRWVNQPALVSC